MGKRNPFLLPPEQDKTLTTQGDVSGFEESRVLGQDEPWSGEWWVPGCPQPPPTRLPIPTPSSVESHEENSVSTTGLSHTPQEISGLLNLLGRCPGQ